MPITLAAAGIDYLDAILAGGPVGLSVLGVLLLASGWSWAIIIRKSLQLRKAHEQSLTFLESFWQSKNLPDIYARAEMLKESPVSQVFRAGYVELVKLTGEGTGGKTDADGLENIERALRRAATTELTHLEAQTSFLGTTAAAAPFVGLFGTVVGIIAAFEGIAKSGSGGLGAVSAGIAEALIVTGIGLGVAIPAVLLFNYLSGRIDRFELALQTASGELVDQLEKNHGSDREQRIAAA